MHRVAVALLRIFDRGKKRSPAVAF